MTNYISSMTSNYGDFDAVRNDVKTLNDILSRQGNQLLIDVIAENAGNTAVKFSFNEKDRNNLIASLINSLKESLIERL